MKREVQHEVERINEQLTDVRGRLIALEVPAPFNDADLKQLRRELHTVRGEVIRLQRDLAALTDTVLPRTFAEDLVHALKTP